MKKSIDRAVLLLGTSAEYEKYESIKIKPSQGGCCCFHCWPRTWESVNEHISPCGPLCDEGDVLIENDSDKYVLECHESGPEIILYLGLGTASILLIKSIVELITVFLKTLEKDKKTVGDLKIIRRRLIKGKTNEEVIMEINLPLPKAMAKELNSKLEKLLKYEQGK
jgi:hypothetical protein